LALTLQENRHPAFWQGVAEHPEVAPHAFLGRDPVSLEPVVTSPAVLPLASAHGGFLFVQLDQIGRVRELHTLYTPEGWGREVLWAAKQAFDRVFSTGCQVVTTYEVEGWWRSRPPKSFGFQRAGDFGDVPGLGASLSTWILTVSAWEASPARKRG
jgi:hypothetical protein